MFFLHIIMYSLLSVSFLQAADGFIEQVPWLLSLYEAYQQRESLKQKQILLHCYNVMNIKTKEPLLPTNDPQMNLAIIYNNVTFL